VHTVVQEPLLYDYHKHHKVCKRKLHFTTPCISLCGKRQILKDLNESENIEAKFKTTAQFTQILGTTDPTAASVRGEATNTRLQLLGPNNILLSVLCMKFVRLSVRAFEFHNRWTHFDEIRYEQYATLQVTPDKHINTLTKTAVFWVVVPCSLVEVCRRFRSPWCPCYYSSSWWCKQQGPLKRRYTCTRVHGATTQNTADSHLRTHRR
jgi:hypothetical protein